MILRIHQHDVADVNRCLLRDDSAGLGTPQAGPDLGVLLDPVDALDQQRIPVGVGLNNPTADSAVLPGDHLNGVALLDLHESEHLRERSRAR